MKKFKYRIYAFKDGNEEMFYQAKRIGRFFDSWLMKGLFWQDCRFSTRFRDEIMERINNDAYSRRASKFTLEIMEDIEA